MVTIALCHHAFRSVSNARDRDIDELNNISMISERGWWESWRSELISNFCGGSTLGYDRWREIGKKTDECTGDWAYGWRVEGIGKQNQQCGGHRFVIPVRGVTAEWLWRHELVRCLPRSASAFLAVSLRNGIWPEAVKNPTEKPRAPVGQNPRPVGWESDTDTVTLHCWAICQCPA